MQNAQISLTSQWMTSFSTILYLEILIALKSHHQGYLVPCLMMSFLYPATILPQQTIPWAHQKPGLLPAIAFWQKGSEKEMGNLTSRGLPAQEQGCGGGGAFLEKSSLFSSCLHPHVLSSGSLCLHKISYSSSWTKIWKDCSSDPFWTMRWNSSSCL